MTCKLGVHRIQLDLVSVVECTCSSKRGEAEEAVELVMTKMKTLSREFGCRQLRLWLGNGVTDVISESQLYTSKITESK